MYHLLPLKKRKGRDGVNAAAEQAFLRILYESISAGKEVGGEE